MAEMLEGRQRTVTTAKQKTATAVGALTFLPEVIFDLAARLTAGTAAGKLASGLATGFAIPRIAAEGLARRGMTQLEGAAHALIQHRYDARYYTATDLAPYVWATLMADLSHRSVRPEVLENLATRFRQSYAASADMRPPEHTPRPLRAMYVYLRDGFSARDAISIFEDREADDRRERARRLAAALAPPPSTQPRGEERQRLRESAEEYQFFVTHPYHALEARMRRVSQSVNGNEPGSLQEMAAVMSALIERAQLKGPDQSAFTQLVSQSREKYGDMLRDMLLESARDIAAGRAPLGVLRLADSFVRQQSLWEGWAYQEDADRLYRAIEAAAFKWFEQPTAAYGQNWPFRQMLYAAYVHRRTYLGGGVRSMDLAKQRAWGLLRCLPNRRRLRNEVERDLPVAIQGEVFAARKLLKTKTKKVAA
jgi:hypothetical protein